jgi:hypothetical protein
VSSKYDFVSEVLAIVNDGWSIANNDGIDLIDVAEKYLNISTVTLGVIKLLDHSLASNPAFNLVSFKANELKLSTGIASLGKAIQEGNGYEITSATLSIVSAATGILGALPPGAVPPPGSTVRILKSPFFTPVPQCLRGFQGDFLKINVMARI